MQAAHRPQETACEQPCWEGRKEEAEPGRAQAGWVPAGSLHFILRAVEAWFVS